jgi:peptidoglycan/LPS O-acetylase OafA/YrhL
MKIKTIYFPGLNGLRAIAAIAVVISHITLELRAFNLNPIDTSTFADGTPSRGLLLAAYGVTIFFVLSGFLITYLLQAEKNVNEISVKKFYMRRILRIWPLYYAYLALALCVILIYHVHINYIELPFYIFFSANVDYIFYAGIPLMVHYWSLGVEEQFYLFWPWINKKITRIVPFTFLLITIMVGTKLGLHYFLPDTALESVIHFTRFHCMMIGALGAILYKQDNKLFLKIFDNKISQGAAWMVILLLIINKYHIISVLDHEIVSVFALILIIGQIRIKNRIINLERKIFDFLGKISYGIYVIHPILIFLFSKIFIKLNVPALFNYMIVYISLLCMTIFFSYLSYTYFEKYFLTLKRKFIVVNSSATNTEVAS